MQRPGELLAVAGLLLVFWGVFKAAGIHGKSLGAKIESGGLYIGLGAILLMMGSWLTNR